MKPTLQNVELLQTLALGLGSLRFEKKTKRVSAYLSAVVLATIALGAPVQAQSSSTLERLMQVKPEKPQSKLSPVREAALKGAANTLGMQTGLIERAREINKEIEARRSRLENTYRFGDLVIGSGVLPPVLVATENASSVTDNTMRLAGSIYKIIQPARFFSGAPSWRDWLLLGLPVDEPLPAPPREEQLLPRNGDETIYWQLQIKEAYASGRAQAQEIFDNNLAALEQVYVGMRTFFELYQRRMVSAPVIAKSQEIVTQDDKNTIVVGDTFFRITMPAEFKTNPKEWKALEAKPASPGVVGPLPVTQEYSATEIAAAHTIFEQQQARKRALALAKSMGLNVSLESAIPVQSAPATVSKSGVANQNMASSSANAGTQPVALALPVTEPGKTIYMRITDDLQLVEVEGPDAKARAVRRTEPQRVQSVPADTKPAVQNNSAANDLTKPLFTDISR